MNKYLVVIAFLLAMQFTLAQDYKFGKVSKEELLETENPQDTEANATVLYRNQHIHFDYAQGKGFIQKNAIHERIKIYNKEGFDEATKIIKLYNESGSKAENINNLKAITYNIEGSKIIETKLKKSDVFEEESNKYWKKTKFTMPNIKEGSVIEYKYVISSPFSQIDEVNFQQEIPIKILDFKLETPEYYNYKKYVNPKAAVYPEFKETEKNERITLTSKQRETTGGFSGVKTTYNSSTIDLKENVVTTYMVNVPALKKEPMVLNLNNYRSQVRFELNYIKFPNETMESFSTTWEKVSKTIYDSENFGGQLKKSGYYDDDVNAILGNSQDPIDKATLLYDFVKTKVKWNELIGYYTDLGVKKAYKEGIGSVADINLMLVSMLRHAGLKADPVLISTKSNGIPSFPTRNGFNYVIAAINHDNGYILFDATEKFSTPHILPLKVLNWQGRLIRKDGTSSWVDLNPKSPSKEMTSLNVKIDSDLSITGKVMSRFTDYQALNYRKKYENNTNEEIIENLQEDKGEIEISNLIIKNQDDLQKPVMQSYEYKYDSGIEQIGDKLYFSPLLFLTTEENPFKEDLRNYPIDFIYPIADKYIVNIMLPEGYVVDTLPKSAKTKFNEADGEFAFLVKQNGNMLQLTMTLNLNKTLILSSEYDVFKQFYQMMIDKQTEKVVLSKAI